MKDNAKPGEVLRWLQIQFGKQTVADRSWINGVGSLVKVQTWWLMNSTETSSGRYQTSEFCRSWTICSWNAYQYLQCGNYHPPAPTFRLSMCKFEVPITGVDQRCTGRTLCNQLLRRHSTKREKFLLSITTCDETCLSHFTRESKWFSWSGGIKALVSRKGLAILLLEHALHHLCSYFGARGSNYCH